MKKLPILLIVSVIILGGILLPGVMLSRSDNPEHIQSLPRELITVEAAPDTEEEYAYRLCQAVELLFTVDNPDKLINYTRADNQANAYWAMACRELRVLAQMGVVPASFPDEWEKKAEMNAANMVFVYDIPNRKNTLFLQIGMGGDAGGVLYLDPAREKIVYAVFEPPISTIIYDDACLEGLIPAAQYASYLGLGEDCSEAYFPGIYGPNYENYQTGLSIDSMNAFFLPGSEDEALGCWFHYDSESAIFGVCQYGSIHQEVNDAP